MGFRSGRRNGPVGGEWVGFVIMPLLLRYVGRVRPFATVKAMSPALLTAPADLDTFLVQTGARRSISGTWHRPSQGRRPHSAAPWTGPPAAPCADRRCGPFTGALGQRASLFSRWPGLVERQLGGALRLSGVVNTSGASAGRRADRTAGRAQYRPVTGDECAALWRAAARKNGASHAAARR